MDLAPGEIHALVGANGSGKSTLIKILAGVHSADAGTLEIDGQAKDLTHFSAAASRASRLRFVHQESSTFGDLTVAENFGLASGFATDRLGRIRGREVRRRTREALERLGLEIDPTKKLESLRPADQVMVAIARAVYGRADDSEAGVLVLDEPTAVLPRAEVDLLLSALRQCAQTGESIVFVSHRLDEVLAVAERLTVLRDGKQVATVSREEVDHDRLIELIVGRPVEEQFPVSTTPAAPEDFLVVKALAGGTVEDVSLTVRRGELVGLAGLAGAGCSTILRLLFGAQARSGGTVSIDGRQAALSSPKEAMEHGIALVPPDRARNAIFPEQSVEENLTIASISRYWSGMRLSRRRERREAEEDMERYSVVAAGAGAAVSQLSGGNQQKVVLGRWLRRDPQLILLDEPTQGVDIGARAELWALVREAVAAGAAVLVASSDLEELAHVCNRVLLVRGGRIAGEAAEQALTVDRLNHMLLTGAKNA